MKMDGKVVTYLINGRSFRFIKVHMEGGMLRGYCPIRKKHAWLEDLYVQFDDEPLVLATIKTE